MTQLGNHWPRPTVKGSHQASACRPPVKDNSPRLLVIDSHCQTALQISFRYPTKIFLVGFMVKSMVLSMVKSFSWIPKNLTSYCLNSFHAFLVWNSRDQFYFTENPIRIGVYFIHQKHTPLSIMENSIISWLVFLLFP